jgi:putative hydrolase of HD superfamily
MKTKADMPINLLDHSEGTDFGRVLFELTQLKYLYRQGWLRVGVPEQHCESVADHSYLTALACMLLVSERPELDSCRVLHLAILHDVGEAYVGDITPYDNISKKEKNRREHKAVHDIFEKYSGGLRLIKLWEEYVTQSSPEARFVKEIDRLELSFQAEIYQRQGLINAKSFFDYARKTISCRHVTRELEAIVSPFPTINPATK